MSTRRSSRARIPSNLAVQAAASSQPPRKRFCRSRLSSVPSLVVLRQGYRRYLQAYRRHLQVYKRSPTAEIIDTIVQRVTDAVTQRLANGASHDNSQSLAFSASTQPATSAATPGLAPPTTLLEVPVGAPHSSTPQAQVAGPATTAPPAPGPSPGPSSSSLFAEAVVNNSLAITQASIAGMPSTPECLFTSPSLAIDARVSEKIRGKYWNNEYFEFSLLLTNPVVEDRYQLMVKGAEGNSAAPVICLEPVAKSKKGLMLHAWFNCFHIFVAIYCQKYPTEAPALMKYGEVVQDLAARGHNWKFYDENFRFLRQSQSASFPWGAIHWELRMHSQKSVIRKVPIQPPSSRTRFDILPLGYCFKFSRGAECAGCQYKHMCYKCKGSHPPRSCLFRAHSKASKTPGQAAKPSIPRSQPK